MYSIEVRNIALRLYKEFNSLRRVARAINCAHSTVSMWLANPPLFIRNNITSNRIKLLSPLVINFMKVSLDQNPFVTCKELVVLIKDTFKFSCSRQLVSLVIKTHLKYSRKVAHFVGKPNPLKIATFVEARDNFTANGKQFVILDETGFQHHIGFKRGYAKLGKRLRVENKNKSSQRNVSVLAVISSSSLISYQKQNKPYDRVTFLEFLKKHKDIFPKGCVVVMDNVSFHHCKEIKAFIHECGWDVLYTPPYSPWYSPIEGVFSVVKNHYYKHQNIDDAFAIDLKVNAFYKHSWSLNATPDF